MKRLTCTLAALAMVMSAYIPAQAEFKGTLQRDQDWFIEINSQSFDAIAVTVYYLGRNLEVVEIMTVPAVVTIQRNIPKPGRGVKRVVVEVDPPLNGRCTIRIVQGAETFLADFRSTHDGDSFRWVFDVE